MAALHVTLENFDAEVLQSDKPVLIDFWAAWCGPCKMLMPVIEELAGELTDVKVCKVDVDDQPALAARFNVMSIPTLVVIKGDKATAMAVGVQTAEQLDKLMAQ